MGFENDVLVCNNVNFNANAAKPHLAQVTTDGQLLIGATAYPNIKVGTLTSPDGSVAFGYSSPNITLSIPALTTVVTKLTPDTGINPVTPSSGIISVLGRSGCKTNGATHTLTINAPPFSQVSGAGTSLLNTGEFVTAAVARTLPLTAGLLDGDLLIYYATSTNAVTVTANTGQTIRVGNVVSASAGTAVSTQAGDSLTLRFNATAVSWQAVSVVGNWVVT